MRKDSGFLMTVLTLLVVSGAQAKYGGKGRGFDHDVPAIFSFGDSTTDPGNNQFLENPGAAFLANIAPYGQTFFDRPTGRFSDGRLWVDLLAQGLGLPVTAAYRDPATKDYTKGVNFASGGSGHFETTKTSLAAIFGGRTVTNIREQLEQFRRVKSTLIGSLGEKKAELLLDRSLYVISSGANDIAWGYLLNTTMQQVYSPDVYTTRIINATYDTVLALYAEGAKKFIINGQNPIGCTPANVGRNGGTCFEPANALCRLVNSKLPDLQQRLTRFCPGVFVVYTDNYKFLEGIVKTGSAYGFTKGSLACCGTGPYNGDVGGCGAFDANGAPVYNLCSKETLGEYLYWDYAHFTEKVNNLQTGFYINGREFVKPFNVSTLARC
ncbi:hypothetical protein Mapa_015853 [Marchantia paleacea]|nr:hypothetical protein Mapa_015853 [Marchantia paleacea]